MEVIEGEKIMSNENNYWEKFYEQAEPIPAKYLHADGTIDENPGSGGGGGDSGSATAYAWSFAYNGELVSTVYFDFDTSPIEANDDGKRISYDAELGISIEPFMMTNYFYTRNSDTSFTLLDRDFWGYTRDSTKDFTLWQLSE